MRSTLSAIPASALVACIVLTGCASTQPHPYSGLQSSARMKPNLDDETGRIPYRVAKNIDWSRYSSVMVDPVTVYDGSDNQFEDVSPQERASLARYMDSKFPQALRKRFRVVNEPGPETLRLRLTLTGAKTNTAFVSTFTRFDLGGGPYNIVQGIRGKEGAFMGSVMYAVEIFDASSNRLLDAFVTKQYPNAMNVSATIGKLEAARTGIEKGAEALATQLQ